MSMKALAEAAAAVAARLDRFFPEGYDDAATDDPLDAANPYWDSNLDTGTGNDFCFDPSGASLDL
jgi:hypothetical protein